MAYFVLRNRTKRNDTKSTYLRNRENIYPPTRPALIPPSASTPLTRPPFILLLPLRPLASTPPPSYLPLRFLPLCHCNCQGIKAPQLYTHCAQLFFYKGSSSGGKIFLVLPPQEGYSTSEVSLPTVTTPLANEPPEGYRRTHL
jgi:hypothetical protein